jgi:arsenite-transporting ATPase
VLGRAVGVPLPHDRVFGAVERFHAELAEVQEVLQSTDTSVRLVLTPEAVVVAEARRTLTSLALYGYRVDAVLANRVFPDGGDDPWRAGWVAAQQRQLAEVEASFAPLPVHRAAYRPVEPVGVPELLSFALDTYGEGDPFAAGPVAELLRVERDGDGFVLKLGLPLAERQQTDLTRVGQDLVVTVGSRRRVLALPSALSRCVVESAVLRDGVLVVRFVPDLVIGNR